MQFTSTHHKHIGASVKIGSFILMLNLIATITFGQAAGDYRTFASGAWDNAGTWERFDGLGWVNPAPAIPSSADGAINIQANHIINVPGGVTVSIDQTVIANSPNARLVINSGGTVILDNGPGNDLTLGAAASRGRIQIDGTFRIEEGAAILNASAARIVVNATGIYQHNYTDNPGIIYTSTWASGSTLEIMGYTTNTIAPTGLNQTFHHFIWNCTNQGDDIDLNGTLNAIGGNFTVSSTGNDWFLKLSDVADYTLNVTGNLTVSGSSILFFSAGSAIATVNITGNFNNNANTSSSAPVLAGGSGNVTLNVSGNMTNNDDLIFSDGTGIGTVNLTGNFANNAGLITENSTGSGSLRFAGTAVQTYSSAGNFSNTINYTVNTNAILDLGTSFVSGSGSFTLSASGQLRVGSANGIVNGTTSGNIRVTGARTYAATSTIVYNGLVSQVTGNGLPISVSNLVINNASNVTLSNALNITGNLSFQSGKFLLGNINLTIAGTGSISGATASTYVVTNGNGALTINNVGASNILFPIGLDATYNPVTINNTGIVDNISARVFAGTVGGVPAADMVNRTWDISEATAGGSDFSLTLSWNLAEEGVNFDRTASGIGQYDAGNNWIGGGLTNAAGSDPYTQSSTGNTLFALFGVGDDLAPLPVKLVSFTASLATENEVAVNWVTASELNNEYFDVEFSRDGQTWETHGAVAGHGNSNSMETYSFNDKLNIEAIGDAEMLYYRLKQVDFDGRFEYSWVVTVKLSENAVKIGECYPNPFSEMMTVSYQKEKSDKITLELIDLQGNTILSNEINDFTTAGVASLETSNLPYGMYLVKISNGATTEYRKVIKH
jgi:hypothetical protein